MAGFVRIRQVESRPNLSFGRTLRLSSDRHDLIPPPLATIMKNEKPNFKKMKYLSLILILLIFFSCKKDNSFVVKGKVMNKDSGIIRFSQMGKNFYDAEIYELTNSEFYFKGEIESPEEFFIQYKTKNTPERTEPERYKFFIEPGSKTEIILNTENVKSSEFKGSKTGSKYLKFQNDIFDEFDSKIEVVRNDYQNAQNNNDKELIEDIIKRGDSIVNEKQKWELKYTWNHSKSYISAYLLHEMQFKLPPDTLQTYFNRLDKNLSESKYYKRIQAYLLVQVGKPFVDFELPDSSGTIHRFSTVAKNKVTLIDFWFRGCKACREHNKELKQLYEANKSKGFEIVGVSGDENNSDFVKTIEEDKMTWLNLHDKHYEKSVGSIYELNAYPFNVLVDENGIIVYKANDYENLKTVVDSLMQKK